VLRRLVSTEPEPHYIDVPWIRFLTGRNECEWVGVFCDNDGFVEALDFCEYCVLFIVVRA